MAEAGGQKTGPRAFVIGGGVAGLAAATALARRGALVELFEAGPQAGGRCRSYFDPVIGQVIDNGNHLVLSGNRAVTAYLSRIGARDALAGPRTARFDFIDLAENLRWRLTLDEGPVPLWIFSPARRVPDTKVSDYIAYAPLLWAGEGTEIGEIVRDRGSLWRRLMRPFLLAALNTEPDVASAALAGAVYRGSFAKGGRACRPRIAAPNLASAFVDPAIAFLAAKGAKVKLGARLRGIIFAGSTVRALEFADTTIAVDPKDVVIVAAAAPVAAALVPGLVVPDEFRAIVNAHFAIAPPPHLLTENGAPAMLGVIGGTAEWIFTFEERISVTISGADAIVDTPREILAAQIWADVAQALQVTAPLPPWQIVKERRATFAATPRQEARRPPARTASRNLFLAGDWTRTGLPATLEGAVRSGDTAARLALRHLAL